MECESIQIDSLQYPWNGGSYLSRLEVVELRNVVRLRIGIEIQEARNVSTEGKM